MLFIEDNLHTASYGHCARGGLDRDGHGLGHRGNRSLAKVAGARLHMLHVVVPHHSLLPLIPLVADAERARELAREASMVEQAEAELARLKAERMENSPTVTTLALVGPPAAKIR